MQVRFVHFVLVAILFLSTPIAFADHNININTADKGALVTLTGIGEVKAQAIIDYRTTNGPFQKKEDIMNVSGIGSATYDSIKDHITVEGGSSTAPSPAPSSPTPAPSPQSSSSGSSSTSELTIDAGADRIVTVRADTAFMARAYNGKKEVENAAFTWNFGDGSVGQSAFVTHRFEYAGRYAVVVNSSKDGASATDRFVVSAEPAELAVRALPDGSMEIENLATRDIDLSRWHIQSTGQRFTFPEDSLLLSGQTMRISPSTLHFYAGSAAALHYPSGELAFSAGESAPTISPATSAVAPPPPPRENTSQVAASVPRAQIESGDVSEDVVEAEADESIADIATSSQVAAAAFTSGSWTWWLAAAGLSFGVAAAVFVARRAGKREWNIIEE